MFKMEDAEIYHGRRRTRENQMNRKQAMEIMHEERMAFRLMLEASQGYGMSGIKEWLQQRFTSLDNFLSFNTQSKRREAVDGVITPNNVPEFVIPDTAGSRRPSFTPNAGEVNPTKHNSDTNLSSRFQPTVKAQDVNSNPLSCPTNRRVEYLRMRSSDWEAVTESPTTRRKESVLFGSLSVGNLRSLKQPARSEYRARHKQSMANNSGRLTVAADAALSSSVLSLVSDTSDNESHVLGVNKNRFYNRRRSSAPLNEYKDSRSYGSSPSSFETTSLFISREEALMMAPQGELKLSVQYSRQAETIRVLLIRAENIAKHIKSSNLQLYIKACLLPDKSVRHLSQIISDTHDPYFDEEIFFDKVHVNDLDDISLRLRVYQKLSARRSEMWGEVIIPLYTLNLQMGEEVRMWRELNEKCQKEYFGQIQLTCRFEPKVDRILIEVIQARTLQSNTISRFPDTYVKLTLCQPGRQSQQLKTQVRKSTAHPHFNESMPFKVSPKLEDLTYAYVDINVMNKETIGRDKVRGHTRLGWATRSDEGLKQWRNMISHPENDFTNWHDLLPES